MFIRSGISLGYGRWQSTALRGAAVVLLAGGIALVIQSFDTPASPHLGRLERVPTEPPGVFLDDRQQAGRTVKVGLSFVSFKRDSLGLHTVARLSFSDSVLRRIVLTDSGRQAFVKSHGLWAAPELAGDQAIVFRVDDDGGESLLDRSFPISVLLDSAGAEGGRVTDDQPFTIVLGGDPAAYPGDAYTVRGQVVLRLPEQLRYDNGVDRSPVLPTSLMVRADPSLSSMRVGTNSSTDPSATSFALEVRNARDNKLFSYFMVAAPLCLVALALIVMLRAVPEGDWQSVLALSLGLFAIVPIRQVVVPEGIGQITRLDKFLALDVISVVAVGLLIAAHVLARHQKPRSDAISGDKPS